MLERKLLIPFYVLLFVFGFLQLSEIQAQNNKVQQVHIDQADVLEGKKDLGPDVKVLKGNVVFSHAGSKMFCDSAYFYSATNSLKAFGKIHITRGDSIQLFGDTLLYSGNDRIARVLNHVVLKNDSLSLFTSELTYFMQQDMGAYSTGGLTINKEDTLRSRIGRYYAQRDIFHFSEKVRVTNPKFRIECDTLKHNTKTQISYFLGPTHIYGDSNYIYCENGWYNHKENKAQFNKNARYESKTYSLRGDSLFYDRTAGLGKAFQNVELRDTVQHVSIFGNVARYEEKNEKAVVTKRAMLVQYDTKGDSLFLHADTLINLKRLVGKDTIPKQFVMAYHHVRAWRHDLQMVCDSLVYLYEDSIIQMHRDPIIWSDQHQLSASKIVLYTKNRSPDHMEFFEKSFVASQETDIFYNQIAGTDMSAYFREKELQRIEVRKNANVLYFMKEAEKFNGINKAESDKIIFYLKDKKLDAVLFPTKSKGGMYPIKTTKPVDMYLTDFKWQKEIRPKDKNDIF